MQEQTHNYYEWQPPLKLEGPSLLPWPSEVFPVAFELFIKELSRSTETPIELSALLVLAVVATAAQKKYHVQVKADYIEPVNIWILGILPPASRKSRVYAETTLALREWEMEQKKLIEPMIQSANSKRKTMEARLKECRVQAVKKTGQNYDEMQKNIEQLENEMPDIPTCPQIWTSDVTPEHLGTIMAANSEAMAVLSDEGGLFDILGGLYSDGKANIDLFLQGHSGSAVRVDRGSRPPVFMQRPVLTMGLTVQPQVVKTICNNKTFRGRGLLGRFLYAMPKSNIGSRTLEEPPMDSEHPLLFQSCIRAILSHPEIIIKDKAAQHTLCLSAEAYTKWQAYAKTVEMMMGEEIGYLSHITDWAGKLPGAIARIAALLHIMRYAHMKPWENKIGLEDMAAAVKIGHVLTNHALAVFDLLQEDSAMQTARDIYYWVKQKKIPRFTQRDCLRQFRRLKKIDLRPALELLKEKEILRESELKPVVGRGSIVFDVNPLIFEKLDT